MIWELEDARAWAISEVAATSLALIGHMWWINSLILHNEQPVCGAYMYFQFLILPQIECVVVNFVTVNSWYTQKQANTKYIIIDKLDIKHLLIGLPS